VMACRSGLPSPEAKSTSNRNFVAAPILSIL
jgi:hypothetical protein